MTSFRAAKEMFQGQCFRFASSKAPEIAAKFATEGLWYGRQLSDGQRKHG